MEPFAVAAALVPRIRLLAEIQTGVMLRSLLIALVVVAPFWFLLRRRIAADRRPTTPEDGAASRHDGPTLEALVDEIGRLGAAARASGPEPGGADGGARVGSVTVEVPHDLTMDGDPAPAAVVDAIVRDAIRRSGLVPTAEVDTPRGRLIECAVHAGSEPAN